ncbi:unnamed protein product [Lactuca virosa]|nr:unnamed protein product [Lactuca virosa]
MASVDFPPDKVKEHSSLLQGVCNWSSTNTALPTPSHTDEAYCGAFFFPERNTQKKGRKGKVEKNDPQNFRGFRALCTGEKGVSPITGVQPSNSRLRRPLHFYSSSSINCALPVFSSRSATQLIWRFKGEFHYASQLFHEMLEPG